MHAPFIKNNLEKNNINTVQAPASSYKQPRTPNQCLMPKPIHNAESELACICPERKKSKRPPIKNQVINSQAMSASWSSSSSSVSMASLIYCAAWCIVSKRNSFPQYKPLTLGSKLSAVVKCLMAFALS